VTSLIFVVLILETSAACPLRRARRRPTRETFIEIAKDASKKPDSEQRVDAILVAWERAETDLLERHFEYSLTNERPLFGTKEKSFGEASVKKPGLLRANQKNKQNELTSVLFCNGKSIHLYELASKTETVIELGEGFGFPEKPDQYPDGFFEGFTGQMLEGLSWVFIQLPVKDLKRRFDLKLVKEDENWIYLEIKPRSPKNERHFNLARIALDADTYQARQLWFRLPNGDTQLWDYFYDDRKMKPVTIELLSQGLPIDCEKKTVRIDGREKK
jgi:TIGR03009 family protein